MNPKIFVKIFLSVKLVCKFYYCLVNDTPNLTWQKQKNKSHQVLSSSYARLLKSVTDCSYMFGSLKVFISYLKHLTAKNMELDSELKCIFNNGLNITNSFFTYLFFFILFSFQNVPPLKVQKDSSLFWFLLNQNNPYCSVLRIELEQNQAKCKWSGPPVPLLYLQFR